jgi:hypothetical protein
MDRVPEPPRSRPCVRREIAATTLPEGFFTSLEGTFQAQEEASRTIGILSALSLALIFAILYSRYRSAVLALIIMGSVPLALIGSVVALWIAGLPLSVASMVGFVTLTGIATRNGILKTSHYINLALHEGVPFGPDLVIRGTLERLTPVLMTALSACVALFPLLIDASSPGKEILHPVAVTIFGGLISATILDAVLGRSFHEAVETLTGGELRRTAVQAPVAKKQTDEEYEREQHRKAQWLWSLREPIEGTPAERYLRERRRITCPLPTTLAFLPPRKPEHHPAMIAAFALVDEPEPGVVGIPQSVGSVHLTLLRRDGSDKADVEKPNKPKIVVGSPNSSPIVVATPNDLLGLCITEGIEDALTAHQATGLGAWAAGSAGQMPKLADVIPSYIEAVTILAHDDQAGQDGARKLAEALYQRRIEVIVEGLS